jgi:hypothetical protein
MTLLRKSLLISLAIHLLLLLLFSAMIVQQVSRWIHHDPAMPTVNVQLSREMDVREQVRQQVQSPQPPPLVQALIPRQQTDSPLPPLNSQIAPAAPTLADPHQLALTPPTIAPTIPQAPAAPDLTTPLLPIEPRLSPIREATPLPESLPSADSRMTRDVGPMDERLGRATTPVVGLGVGSLGAPPAALPEGPAGGAANGAGTGKPFSSLANLALPDAAVALQTLPPIAPAVGPSPGGAQLPQRNFDQRQQALQKFGGTPETEAAVARALAYLSRTQLPDGHWTKLIAEDDSHTNDAHDTALTGLALLAFLASNHTPDKPGPYQNTVKHALSYLLLREGKDGDLRGDGNMYDQGIASLAVNEAAAMANDPRLLEPAHRAAQFILDAQNIAGGWRYSPRDLFSDTSVMGWQVMALHSAERTGFVLPDRTREKALQYLDHVSGGDNGMLAGYLTASATKTMTAEATFSRLLLGQVLTPAQLHEVAAYLRDQLPTHDPANFYYMYYGSLALMQIQGDDWHAWNATTAPLLLSLQRRDGPLAGSFTIDSEWGSRGGRIYTTAMATLTLEVYYRYAPMTAPPPPTPAR